jgi:hypothetical protein
MSPAVGSSAAAGASVGRDTARTASGSLVVAASGLSTPRAATSGASEAWASWDGRPSVDAAITSSAAIAATSRQVATTLSKVVKEYLDGTIEPSRTDHRRRSERPLGW